MGANREPDFLRFKNKTHEEIGRGNSDRVYLNFKRKRKQKQ